MNLSKPIHIFSVMLLFLFSSVIFFKVFAAGDHAENLESEEFTKGPHNGRLLIDDDFQVELAIFEKGVPPEYRAWASIDNKPLAPKDWQLSVKLTRLGGQIDNFRFTQEQDFLRGDAEVTEPHSFDVSVTATYKNKQHHWTFASYEGRIQLNADLAKRSGIVTAKASAGSLAETIRFYAQLNHDPAAIRQLSARYPGIVKQVNIKVGKNVKAGDILATIEANESLQPYIITTPISGVITARHAHTGEITGEQPLFTVVDSSRLQLSFPVFAQDAAKIKTGQTVQLMVDSQTISTKLDSVSAANDGTPALLALASLDNHKAHWIAGSRVPVTVTTEHINVALRVDNRALQSFRDWQVVFIQIGDTYEIRPLELGRTDGQFTEVLAGLNSGDTYVVGNSYLLKSDLEKSGASHDH
ncbi:MAG: efflux RND transporter periplasmic adaptor subunit [Gammaproteobacteria bacterium]|nr:efflux RND transporter periplasmic adaptor subunit [Gammaproteobacteria bacterium]